MSGQLQAQWRGVERAPSPTGFDRRPHTDKGGVAHTNPTKLQLVVEEGCRPGNSRRPSQATPVGRKFPLTLV